ncbi:MAG: hypothetical protein IKP65_06690 [Alphaproteobacteria bacterium]|nr:hypothetical protein [Alphaproteobacteria bacterium]
MKSMVYVVERIVNGEMIFDKVFRKKKFAEQYVSNLNTKLGKRIAKVVSTKFADTDFFIQRNKNRPYVEKKNNAKLKWERKYEFAQEVAELINMIYCEKDIKKKREFVTKSLMICQKSRHNIRNHEEMLGFIYDIKNTLEGYKGGFVDPDAELYYMTKIYPIFEKHGDEDFVYYLDEVK